MLLVVLVVLLLLLLMEEKEGSVVLVEEEEEEEEKPAETVNYLSKVSATVTESRCFMWLTRTITAFKSSTLSQVAMFAPLEVAA